MLSSQDVELALQGLVKELVDAICLLNTDAPFALFFWRHHHRELQGGRLSRTVDTGKASHFLVIVPPVQKFSAGAHGGSF